MPHGHSPDSVRSSDGPDLEYLKELEQQSSELVRQRVHARKDAKVKVVLQPGNSSELLTLKIQGVTGDISEGGCRAMFPLPLKVGDIYRLKFDHSQVEIPLVFARCVRCRLVRETAFETGFSFFQPITLPDNLSEGEDLLV